MIPVLWRSIRQRAVKAVAAIVVVPLYQVCGHRGLTYDVDEAWAINAAQAASEVVGIVQDPEGHGWATADIDFAILNAIRSARPD